MKGKVYFVGAPGRIKIGYTRQPEKRLAQLQSVDMETLASIAVIPGTRELERRLHSMAAPHHLRGEWFSDCADVRDLIQRAVAGEFPIDDEAHEESAAHAADVIEVAAEVLRSATAEARSLLDEVGRRVKRGEDVSDLVRSACFLGEHIVAPYIRGLDRA